MVMEVHHYVKHIQNVMSNRNSTRGTIHWMYVSLLLATMLKMLGLLCQSWYVLNVNLNNCSTCGQLIVAMGTLLESSIVNVDNKDFSKLSVKEYFHSQGNRTTIREENLEDYLIDDFTVENNIHVHVGIWVISLCTTGGHRCVGIDLSSQSISLSYMKLFRHILESVHDSRPFVLMSVFGPVITMVFIGCSRSMSRLHVVMVTVSAEILSSLLTFTSVVIAGIPYLSSVNWFSISIPWALVCFIGAGYMELMSAYHVWKRHKMGKRQRLLYWSVRESECM